MILLHLPGGVQFASRCRPAHHQCAARNNKHTPNSSPPAHGAHYEDVSNFCHSFFAALDIFCETALLGTADEMGTSIKILYLGDIVGRLAREFIGRSMRSMRNLNGIDVVIANAENATSGAGITRDHAEFLHASGIDLITLGDHVWDRHGFERDIEDLDYVCRPANIPSECPGRDFVCVERGGVRVAVAVVLGRHFMKIDATCPLGAMEDILRRNGNSTDIFIGEVHGETTAEKIALGWNFDGRVAAIVGTHTHVQTADERILPKGTAYVTDLGMCGPHESVIGREIFQVTQAMRYGMPQKFDVATGDVRLNGVTLTVDVATGLAQKISRFSEKCPTAH
jgi:metallophosphoesterase (TIGR00282 family)